LLQFSGFISADERRYLSEIFQYNPLLFDFVLKRTLRHPESGEKFSSLIFAAHPGLAVKSKP
jgi:mannonate dehydratase